MPQEISLGNVCDTVRMTFLLEPCMRRHEVSRAHKTATLRAVTKTEREGRQQNRRLSAHQSATSATQDLNRFSFLCDSDKYTTCLDIYCKVCLKHFNSSIDQNQRNGEGRGLTVRLLAPSLMPKLTVICHTRSQPWGYGHHPLGSRMQPRTHVNITRSLISTQDPSLTEKNFVNEASPLSRSVQRPSAPRTRHQTDADCQRKHYQ